MFERLHESQLKKIHEASLTVLEKTGLRILEKDAVEIFKNSGCQIYEGNIVRIPSKLVEQALKTVPHKLTLYDQKGNSAINLDGRVAYFGNGSDLLYIIDHKTGERRKPLLKDVQNIVKVVDALPFMDFVMSGFIPSDVPIFEAQKQQMMVMLEYSNKPIIYVTTDLKNTQKNIEMAEIVAGSPDALRERPFAVNYINISNPLRQAPEAIQKLMWLSKKGLPFVYRPSIVTRGISTPITWAGFLVVNNVSQLAGLVLSQIIREGTPFIRCGCSGGTFDMKTLVGLHSAPEIRGFNEDLAEYYRLPRFGIGGVSGSKSVDQQAAYEAALTLIISTQAGAQLIHDVGYMDNGTTGSLIQLVICHEVIGWVKQYMNDMLVNEETLAIDTIDEVVKKNCDFMLTDNTLTHYKEDYYPELTDRDNYDKWISKGGLGLYERARQKVEHILNEHWPEKLSKDIHGKLMNCITQA